MRRRLDSFDIKILEALGIHGPRSVSKIAREIDVPVATIWDRMKHLRKRSKSLFSVFTRANTYHTFIGLKKAFVFAKATPGYERLLWESLKANDYWLYIVARYDRPESFYGIYGIPIDHTEEFEQFVRQIEILDIAQNINLYWSTCIQTVNLTDDWYDYNSERWVFKWDQWIKNIESQRTSLPNTLIESVSYPQKADYIDIIILKELEKNAECRMTDIAKLLGVSPQAVRYHYRNHVVARGLIEGYTVLLPYFDDSSDHYCFRFDFYDDRDMAKFALSLINKPFVRNVGKILGKHALFVQIYLPRREFRDFTDTLSKLIRSGLMRSYDYSVEDFSRKAAQTISYELFKNNMWIYNHKEHIQKLHEIVPKKELR